jgi:transposase
MELARDLDSVDLKGLPADAAALIERLQQEIGRKQILIERQTREIAWRDAKLEKVSFELARLKRWKFGASSEAMNAQQRALFEETMAEDEASLQAQLAALRASLPDTPDKPKAPPRQPRRQHLPEHLRRVEHRHEPESTDCGCGAAMVRVGEDVSERLDIIPAEFFVHRHIYGKWACRCCQKLVQAGAVPEIIDGGIAASGLVAHTLISRFVDHMPYYRQEAVNARSGVHTPRSTLASWSGQGGAALEPLHEALKRFVLQAPVLHADETPVAMLDPGSGKTKRAYVWAYARGELDAQRGVIFDFCLGRGAQYPTLFLGGSSGPPGREQLPWRGTLLSDQYAVYDAVVNERTCSGRIAAACLAHARRKFEELANTGASAVAQEAIRRIALIYHAEGQFAGMDHQQRRAARSEVTRPMWQQLNEWLRLERQRVADGGATAKAIDYSLNCWTALTRHLDDGAVGLDNNFLERQIKPWQMGRKAWLFAGSELAGQRAAMVMSLVQSAKLNGHDPWQYLRDVLARLPTQLNSRIEELLPHRWKPNAD